MPIFYSKKEKGSKPYPNVKFRTSLLCVDNGENGLWGLNGGFFENMMAINSKNPKRFWSFGIYSYAFIKCNINFTNL